jgi:hypothetical protein
MKRDEFFAKLAPLGEDGLAKVMWNLYWPAPAPLRERIEAELDPAERDRRKREAAAPAWIDFPEKVSQPRGGSRSGVCISRRPSRDGDERLNFPA